ncbi:hypothetical protein ABFX02_13G123400 [Erythranthe guttata]
MGGHQQVNGGDLRIHRRWNGNCGGRREWGGSSDRLASTPSLEWKIRGGAAAAVSARKLGACLWKLTATTSGGGGNLRWQYGLFDRRQFQLTEFSTEEATKWDFRNSKEVGYSGSGRRHMKKPTSRASAEMLKPQNPLIELEKDRNRTRAKIEHRTKKVDEEERGSWMIRTEHQNLVDGVKRERRKCKETKLVNSKLLLGIAEAKLSAKKLTVNIGKEKKARKLLEDSCNNLVKQIEGNKAEIGALIHQRKRMQEEVDRERKMMQLAEVWREEHAQTKLVDAKLILEDKLIEINSLIADLEAFLVNAYSVTEASETSSEKPFKKTVPKKKKKKKKKKKESCAIIDKVETNLPRNKDVCKKILMDRNPHLVRATKGRRPIEWPREIRREGENLLEAKLESQKMLVRNVLKQRR